MSGKSSSSGSYSLGGSNPNVTEDLDDKTPTGKPKEMLEKTESKEENTKSPVKAMEQLVPKMIVSNHKNIILRNKLAFLFPKSKFFLIWG